jgi:hypothetical protein
MPTTPTPLITATDITDLINTSGADFSATQIADAISVAEARYIAILELEELPSTVTAKQKKALVLLAVSELATGINLYWKGGDGVSNQILKVKDVIAQVESLLGLAPNGVTIISVPDEAEKRN